MKRAKPATRESILLGDEPTVHLVLEKTARAISDWRSERDWYLHLDKAIRSVEAISEYLRREGHDAAATHLQSVLWLEPCARTKVEGVTSQ